MSFSNAQEWARHWLAFSSQDWASVWPHEKGHFEYFFCQKNDNRELLNQALKRLMNDSHDWGAHVILWIFGRHYPIREVGPGWWQETYQKVLNAGKMLSILPPIRDFRVTYLVLTYNRLQKLKRTIEAIRNQTCSDWLLIICDDASQDQTSEYCAHLTELDSRITYTRNPVNLGSAKTWNRLCELAHTELVASCADDDWLYPDHLAITRQGFLEYPWSAMSAGGFHIVSPEGVLLRKHGPFAPFGGPVDNQRELQRCGLICPVGPGVVHRKELLRHWASVDPLYSGQGEQFAGWDYLLTVKTVGQFEAVFHPQILSFMEGNPLSTYSNRDNSSELIFLLREIVSDYNALYGAKSYPWILAEKFLKNLRLTQIKRQAQSLSINMNLLDVVEAEISSLCSHSEPIKFNPDAPFSDRSRWLEALEYRLIRWGIRKLPLPPQT